MTGWPLVDAAERMLIGRGFKIEATGPTPDKVEIISRLEEVSPDALIVRTGVIDRSCFDAASRLKTIANHGAGYDDIDIDEATRRGIPVFAAPGRNATAVAEHVFALLLAVRKRVTDHDRLVRAGGWRPGKPETAELCQATMGIIGMGAIGVRVATLAAAFGMNVVAFDPLRKRDWPAGISRCENMDDLLTQSDVVSLHVPLTEQTRNLINADAMARMKPGAILINTARGGVVDEIALVDAIVSGHLFGAGLDTFEREPPGKDAAICECPRIVLSPHIAGVTPESTRRMSLSCAQNIIDFLESGQCGPDVVNPHWSSRGAS